VQTIALRCRPHNQYEAEQEFGLRPSTYSRRAHPSSRPSRAVDPVDASGEDAIGRDRSLPWVVRESRSIYGSHACNPVRTEFVTIVRSEGATRTPACLSRPTSHCRTLEPVSPSRSDRDGMAGRRPCHPRHPAGTRKPRTSCRRVSTSAPPT
jgi:hypothetical protein